MSTPAFHNYVLIMGDIDDNCTLPIRWIPAYIRAWYHVSNTMTLCLMISGSISSEMKAFAVLLSVASVAVANIPYTEPGVRPGQGGVAVVRPIVPVIQQSILPGGIATGAAGGDLSQGQFTGVHGTSQFQQLSSSAQVSNVEQNENIKRITHPRDTFVITKVSWCFLLPKWSLRVRCHNLKSLSGVCRSGKQQRIVIV